MEDDKVRIITAETAGFCFGVERAVNMVHDQLASGRKPIYTYGPIIHNETVIGELEDEIAEYNAAFERDQARIRELNSNPKAMEKIARERYFMKADDEDIFVLSDDDRAPKPIVGHEAAE